MSTGDQKTDLDGLSVKEMIINSGQLLTYLKSKWRAIIVIAILGAVAGLSYSFLRKPLYTAEMTFTIEGDDQSASGVSGLAAQFGFDLGGGKGSLFEGDNIIVFFKSRSMVQKTLLSVDTIDNVPQLLINRYILYNGYKEKWSGKPGLENLTFKPWEKNLSRLQDSVLYVFYEDIVKKNLSIDKIDKKLSIISLNYSGTDELFAKSFIEVLTKNVVDFYVKARIQKSEISVNVLQHQADSVRRRLNEAISGVATSIDAEPNANPLKQVLKVSSQKSGVDVQASTAVLTELVRNLEISKVSLLRATPLIEFIDQPILPLKVDKLGKIKGSLIGFILGAIAAVVYLTAKKLFNFLLR